MKSTYVSTWYANVDDIPYKFAVASGSTSDNVY